MKAGEFMGCAPLVGRVVAPVVSLWCSMAVVLQLEHASGYECERQVVLIVWRNRTLR